MHILSLLLLPLAVAQYAPAAAPPAYGNYPAAAAPAYGAAPAYHPVAAAAPVFFPVVRPWGGRPVLDDAFQGPKIRQPLSNPFFVPRFRGEHHIDRHEWGHRWGSEFPRFRHHHHHHHDDDFGHGHRHHHHHFMHQHAPVFVGVPQFQSVPAPTYAAPAYPAPAAAAPMAGNYY